MPKQPVILGLRDAMKKKVTRREQFLAEMDAVVPWTRLLALIAPYYPRVRLKSGRPPMPIETMLRVYFLQNWYALSDPVAEETLYDSDAMRRFGGIELGDDRIPYETTILDFRHLLERHGLTEVIFAEVNGHLADKGITLLSGTLVDATIIDAPSSTKKGNAWYFGMKAHVGVDVDSCTVHSLEATTAKVYDSRIWDELLHGEEISVWADKGYVSAERKAAFTKDGNAWGVMCKAPKGSRLNPIDEATNRVIAMIRAKVEHPFRVLKRERIRRRTYPTRDAAKQDVFEYIELFYNPKCKHTNNGMLSPVDFEIRQQKPTEAGV